MGFNLNSTESRSRTLWRRLTLLTPLRQAGLVVGESRASSTWKTVCAPSAEMYSRRFIIRLSNAIVGRNKAELSTGALLPLPILAQEE